MEELKMIAEVLTGTIEDNISALRKLDVLTQRDEYTHKLGEISAYEDVLSMIIWRMDKVRVNAMRKGDK